MLLSLVVNELMIDTGFIKYPKEHILHTHTSCLYVYINVTINEMLPRDNKITYKI